MVSNSRIQSLLVAIWILGLFVSCASHTQLNTHKIQEIVVYSQCSSEEVSSDILNSIDGIKEQLTKKGIVVKEDHQGKWCGYLLVNGSEIKKITGVLTDVELLQEINTHFK
jgi:hypothetical protein